MRREDARRETLGRLIEQLKTGLDGMRWKLMASPTAIQPLIVGGNAEVLRVSAALAERGVLVPAIRPPTVPDGTARLRISLSAAHATEDVARLVDALRHVEKNS
jgi:8-amino-7-oxononanoate synthase